MIKMNLWWNLSLIILERPTSDQNAFRIRWQGYDESEDTWLPYSEVSKLEALDKYLKEHPELHL